MRQEEGVRDRCRGDRIATGARVETMAVDNGQQGRAIKTMQIS